MTPKQATKAHKNGSLRKGVLVNQMYGFLCGERHNGEVLSVDCAEGVVGAVTVQWPDEATPDKVFIEDIILTADANLRRPHQSFLPTSSEPNAAVT
jgi:hypothetical protein